MTLYYYCVYIATLMYQVLTKVFVHFQLPRVCSYQSTSYTVTIEGAEPKLSITRGPFNGTVLSDTVVISEGLESGKAYLVQVEFSSDTGMLSASKDHRCL